MSSHTNNITRRITVAPSMVESGMVVKCDYTNRHGQTKGYLVICITPNYQGEFHCYKLNNFPPNLILAWGVSMGTKTTRGIQHLSVGNPKSFYNKLKSVGKRDYKRFEHKNMKAVQICSYKFIEQ